MKPQVSIEEVPSADPPYFVIKPEEQGQQNVEPQQFSSYQQALDFILEQGWQLKRETPSNSLHVETRFLKP